MAGMNINFFTVLYLSTINYNFTQYITAFLFLANQKNILTIIIFCTKVTLNSFIEDFKNDVEQS
jgi:hypothetical protein